MLLVLPPTKTNVATLFVARRVLQNKLYNFCYPFYRTFTGVRDRANDILGNKKQ